jgi:hypothetical protein
VLSLLLFLLLPMLQIFLQLPTLHDDDDDDDDLPPWKHPEVLLPKTLSDCIVDASTVVEDCTADDCANGSPNCLYPVPWT